MDVMKAVKTGWKGFITGWWTVSKFVCQKAHARVQLEGDKGSEPVKVANWWLSLKPIFNFTQIWKVNGSKLFRKGALGLNRMKGNHYAVSLGRVLRAKGPLPLVAFGVSLIFREALLGSVPLSGADRQGVACWCIWTAGRESVGQTEGALAEGCGH